jgi:hypothetical protein
MGREFEESKYFSDNLDRLLAGEEVQTGSITSDELLSALDFAKKMTILRNDPSAPFQANLKARLLQRLADREAAGETSWFGRMFGGQRIWMTAAVCAALLILVGGVLWKTGVINPPGSNWVSPPVMTTTSATTTATTTATATTTTATLPGRYLLVDASVDKPLYQPGETVKINVELTNVSGKSFTITQFPPILSLMESDTKQAVYNFTAGNEVRTIPAGQKTDFTLTWNQINSKGVQVGNGSYYIELEDLDLQGQAVKLKLANPVEFDILSPGSKTY